KSIPRISPLPKAIPLQSAAHLAFGIPVHQQVATSATATPHCPATEYSALQGTPTPLARWPEAYWPVLRGQKACLRLCTYGQPPIPAYQRQYRTNPTGYTDL